VTEPAGASEVLRGQRVPAGVHGGVELGARVQVKRIVRKAPFGYNGIGWVQENLDVAFSEALLTDMTGRYTESLLEKCSLPITNSCLTDVAMMLRHG